MPPISNLNAYLLRVFTPSTTTNNPGSSPAASTDEPEPRKCRFHLDSDSSDTIILPDGRKLGYAQYGSLTGWPIFYLHGLLGSRIEAAFSHDMGLKLDARIVGVDRPGIGWSLPQPERTLLDHPKDLEQLAKHLELDEYSILAISGGGPYALACAIALSPEKLKCVSIVCGLGPPDVGMRRANFISWVGFTFGWRWTPRFIGWWFLQTWPGARVDLSDSRRLELLQQEIEKSKATYHPKDSVFVDDEDTLRLSLRSQRESFAQGCDAVLLDGKLMSSDFRFRVEDIRPDLPVQLWYGKHDTFVPLRHGEQIVARLGGRARLRVEDETHASIPINFREEILRDLLRGT